MNDQAGAPTNGQIIERALELRDYIREREKAFKSEMSEYENALEGLENYLLKVMQDRGGEKQIKTDAGTAFQSMQMRVSMANRDHLIEYTVMSSIGSLLKEISTLVPELEEIPVSIQLSLAKDAINQMDFGFWTNHIAKDHVKEYRDEKGVDPPGVEVTQFIACHIRKA
jgi:hypothetical protein